MQFTVLALLSLVAFAFAAPVAQSTQTQPNGEGAAMSNASGDVVTFDTAGVYKAASEGDA
ncbi:hypothetical protein V8E51_012579 [Hyaloscypha variabilis]